MTFRVKNANHKIKEQRKINAKNCTSIINILCSHHLKKRSGKMEKNDDVIAAICYGNDALELDEYFKLAIAMIVKHDNEELRSQTRVLTSSTGVDDTFKKVTFFTVLNSDAWLKNFVCESGNACRVSRGPINREIKDVFFTSLRSICDDYMNSHTTEAATIQRIQDAYEGKYEPLQITQAGPTKRASKKRSRTKKRSKGQAEDIAVVITDCA